MRSLSKWVRSNDVKRWPGARPRAERSRGRGRRFLVEVLEPRQLLSGLTLTAAGRAAGFGLSTFATGFPNAGNIGPFGTVFPATGGVLVSDSLGNVRLFPTDADGQDASAVSPVPGANYPSSATGMARVGPNLYLMMTGRNQIGQLNNNGTLERVAASVPSPLGVTVNPINGHLFVSSFAAKIYDVNPLTGAVSVFLNVEPDGLAFDAGTGILYAAFDGAANGDRVEGLNVATKAVVFRSGTISAGPDGIALGTGTVAGNLFVNTNGGTVVEVNLATSAQTVIASGGSRGDFVTVDPYNGTLLLTQTDRIMRITPGVFAIPPYQLTTTTTLDVTPQTSNFGPTLTLTAVVATAGTGIPAGTVTFTINGQAQAPVSLTEVGGLDQATLTTSTLIAGTDAITATYSGDATFASSGSEPVSVTIIPARSTGPNTPTRTVLTARPRRANLGRAVTLTATVKALTRGGSTPSGYVTFLDGTVSLGSFALRRGKASLKTASLPKGPDTIHADYTPSQGFVPSTAAIVENVQAHRSGSKAAPSAKTKGRAVRSTPMAIRVEGFTDTRIIVG